MTDISLHQTSRSPASFISDDEGANRMRAFDKARRHSRHVHILKIALPLVTCVVFVVFAASILKTSGVGKEIAAAALPSILPTDLAMKNPVYEGYTEDGGMYKVRAEKAKPNLKNMNLIQLTAITADLIDGQKQKTKLTATRGLYDNDKSLLVLRDGIDVSGENGLKIKLKQAKVFTKTKVITSDVPVDVKFPAGSVQSNKMKFSQNDKHVHFYDNVDTNLKPPPNTDTPKDPTTKARQLFVGSDEPVAIRSKTLDIFDADKRAVFKGHVTAKQGLATLSAPELEASYDSGDQQTSDAANSQNVQSDNAATGLLSGAGGKLRRIIAKGPVVMTQGPQDRVTCEAADFDALNETAVLTGNVVMTSGAARSARSDRVDLDQANERAVLTGAVVVKQDKNVLKGRRLDVDQRNGTTRLSSPAGLGYGAGQISARFVQTGKPQRTAAANKTPGGGAFRVDRNAPLDVTATELLVRDKIKTAIFSGGVKAHQGGFRIAANELHAKYQGAGALGAISPTGADRANTATTLTQINAKKDVVITGNDGQKVTGDWAEFDVAAGKAVVGGRVEVLQGGNIVHGSRLTIDTNTGQTMIDTAPNNTVAKPGGGGWVTTGGGQSGQTAARRNSGRPSAIFYLNDVNKARKKGRTRSQAGGSAWEAQNAPQ